MDTKVIKAVDIKGVLYLYYHLFSLADIQEELLSWPAGQVLYFLQIGFFFVFCDQAHHNFVSNFVLMMVLKVVMIIMFDYFISIKQTQLALRFTLLFWNRTQI